MMNAERKRKRVYCENDSSSSSSSAIYGLPKDLMVEILANVAATSFDDFFSAKQCCKLFVDASEDDYIYKRITLEKLPEKLWWTSKKAKDLIRLCIKSGNSDALYWQGLFEYFSAMKLREGIILLREAARAGDISATYILGVIYVCSDDELLKKEGAEILKKVYREGKVGECRRKYKRMIDGMWMNNRSVIRGEPAYECPSRDEHWNKGTWSREARVRDGVQCEACICKAETMFLYRYCKPMS